MKKHKIELITIFIISLLAVILLSNFPKNKSEFAMPSLVYLVKWTSITFVGLVLIYFARKPKPDKERSLYISDGYQEIYNENNQIIKKGIFEGGKLYNGKIYVYKKDGTLSSTEVYKEGIYIGNDSFE